jgi:hypothetical protein
MLCCNRKKKPTTTKKKQNKTYLKIVIGKCEQRTMWSSKSV